ncbi:SRPBCC domain-containing protein [Propionibacteriaceae bacterium Y1685]
MTTSTRIYSIYIDAPAQKIWDAITSSEYTTQYGYAGPVEYELSPGGRYTAFASEEMKKMDLPDIVISGEVLEVDPPKKLVQKWDPAWLQEPPITLTWEITEFPDGPSRLTLTQDSTDAPETERQTAGGADPGTGGGGWPWVLASMKTLIETGKPMTGVL